MIRKALALVCSLLALAGPAWAAPRLGGTPIPPAAFAAGYRDLTFATASDFNTSTVDKSLTYGSGFQWYFWNFLSTTPSASTTTLNPDGSITIGAIPGDNYEATLASAGCTTGGGCSGSNWHGIAFGGGAYFEAEIAIDANAVDTNFQWPAWWSIALEHCLASDQWFGQTPGYEHYIEPDFFEYNRGRALPYAYGGSVHDWFAIFDSTCPPGFCVVDTPFIGSTKNVPPGTNWGQFHRIAMLWVPATPSTNGSYTFFFDDIQMGAPVSYAQFVQVPLTASGAFTASSPNISTTAANPGTILPGMTVYDSTISETLGVVSTFSGTSVVLTSNSAFASGTASDALVFTQAAPPTQSTPWTFGVVDIEHLVLILGSGQTTPMQVRSVHVWQASGAGNETN